MIALPSSWASARGVLEGFLLRVLRSQVIQTYSPTTANEAFIVMHKLGATPSIVCSLPDADCRVYATSEDRKEWGKSVVKLRCSAANRWLTLEVKA